MSGKRYRSECYSKSSVADPNPDLEPDTHVLGPTVLRIHMFWGLLDPDPDPLVRGMDPDSDLAPDPDLSITVPSKNSKKNLDSYCFL
jgi:hypothetical protein